MLLTMRTTRLIRVFLIAALLIAFNTAFAYAVEGDLDAGAVYPAQISEESCAPAEESPAPTENDASVHEAQVPSAETENTDEGAASSENAPAVDSENVGVTTDPSPNAATNQEGEQAPDINVTPADSDEGTPAETADGNGTAIEEPTVESDLSGTAAEEPAVEDDPGDTAAEEPTVESCSDDTAAEEPAAKEQTPATAITTTNAAAASTGKSVSAKAKASTSAAKKASKRSISAKKYKKLLKLLYKGLKKHASRINISKLRLHRTDVRTLDRAFWDVIYEKHPEIFWARGDYYYWWNGAQRIYKIKPYYLYGKKKTKTLKRKYEKSMKQMMSWVPKKATPAKKAKAVHDWLIRKCSYNYTAIDNKPYWFNKNSKRYPWTALGAMVYKEPVCQGYALAFQDAMNRLKIKCITVEGSNHAWNRIKIGKKWYTVDITNDDDGGLDDIPSTSLFLKSTSYCKQHFSSMAVSSSWKMMGGYAPSGSKASGTVYDNTSTLAWKIYGPKIDLIWADWYVTSDAYQLDSTMYKPSISLTMSNNYTTFDLVEGRDYTISYEYYAYSGKATITGKGSFTGTRTAYFDITRY